MIYRLYTKQILDPLITMYSSYLIKKCSLLLIHYFEEYISNKQKDRHTKGKSISQQKSLGFPD